jgi:DNA polymerase III subunit gamma/tau
MPLMPRTKAAEPTLIQTPDATPGASQPPKQAGYTVLARRYRSRDFDELIGQEPIARTLQNAIATDRTAHAYLFCGTRGVGKTSMARIFAKALNVSPNLTEADAIANAILRGDDLDVIEIDAASNRGIDNARDLIANAGLSPARCRYKIYIIDEVHMLTTPAFNALLKTMEEPPSHVKFILCTTEANKVPATIQSRCQRFDFRPIPTPRIADQLRTILKAEGIDADEEVITQVALLGNGSMRDALSVLDRLLAAGEPRLTMELLEQMIGLPDHALIVSLMDAMIAGDAKSALERGDALLRSGATIEQAMEMIAEHLRTLMVLRACGEETPLLEISAEAKKIAAAQAQHFDTAGLVHLIAICDAVSRNAKNSLAARALFDAALVRMCMSEHFADVSRLLAGGARTAAPRDGEKKKHEPRIAPEPPRLSEPERAPAPRAASPDAENRPVEPADGESLWAQTRASATSAAARAKLDHLLFESFDGSTLRLAIDEEGARMARILASQADSITDMIRRATGRAVRVEITQPQNGIAPQSSVNDHAEVHTIPAVKHAIDIFDATVIEVRDT